MTLTAPQFDNLYKMGIYGFYMFNFSKDTRKYDIFFIIILIFFVLIRLFGINQPVVDDETNFVQSINNPGPYLTINPFDIHPHPPLGSWGFLLFGKIFGLEVWAYRLVPLLLWLINLTLVYVIVKREYSPRAALFSSLIMGLSYYSALISLQIDVEGSFLILSFLLMTLFYLNYLKSNKKIYLFLLGLSFGMGLWTKISAVFFIPILVLHRFINLKRNNNSLFYCFKTTLLEMFIVTAEGGLIFSIFPLLMPRFFSIVMGNGAHYYGLNFSWMAISMLLFWATPFLIGLFLFQALKFNEKDSFWVIWFLVIFTIYAFLIAGRPGTQSVSGGVADYSRHFMNLMVPFSILGGVFLSRLRWNKNKTIIGTALALLLLLSFFLINLNTTRVLPRDFSTYLNSILNLDLNFIFTFTTSCGNLLGVNIGIMIFSILLMALLFLLYFLIKKSGLKTWLLVFFISVGVALNLFLITEYLGPVTSPDVNRVFYEMAEFSGDNFKGPNFYATDEGHLLLFNRMKYELGDNQYNLGPNLETIPKSSFQGTVLFLNWPPKLENLNLTNKLKLCAIKKEFFAGQMLLGRVYYCK